MADLEVIYCYMNGCGWCDKFEPIWQELKTHETMKGCSGKVQYSAKERQQLNDPKYSELDNHVKGFPTILVKINNTIHKYEGNRTVEDILKFIANKLQMQTGGMSVDYRTKYKKYKKMYAEIVTKYNALKHQQI